MPTFSPKEAPKCKADRPAKARPPAAVAAQAWAAAEIWVAPLRAASLRAKAVRDDSGAGNGTRGPRLACQSLNRSGFVFRFDVTRKHGRRRREDRACLDARPSAEFFETAL